MRRAGTHSAGSSGDVIAAVNENIFDYGVARRPHIGTFLPDGRSMEGNGAKPDGRKPSPPLVYPK